MKHFATFFVLIVLNFATLPYSRAETDTEGWDDARFAEAVTTAYEQAQAEFAAYQEILIDYKPSSKPARDQLQKIRPFLVEYFQLLESWKTELNSYQKQLLKDGMHTQSPKVKAVQAKTRLLAKMLGKFGEDRLPASFKELESIFSHDLELGEPVRAVNSEPSRPAEPPVRVPRKVPQPGERMVKTVNGVEFAFRWCPPGKFVMGCTEESFKKAGISWKAYDSTPHEVVLTKGFWMMETEITQSMW